MSSFSKIDIISRVPVTLQVSQCQDLVKIDLKSDINFGVNFQKIDLKIDFLFWMKQPHGQ